MTYIDDLKHEHFIEDMELHFSRVKITDFDIINHQGCSDPLQSSLQYYETIFNSGFKSYENRTHNQMMSSAIKATLDDIDFKSNLLKSHIKSDIRKDLISNGFFVKNARKKRTNDDCKSLKH